MFEIKFVGLAASVAASLLNGEKNAKLWLKFTSKPSTICIVLNLLENKKSIYFYQIINNLLENIFLATAWNWVHINLNYIWKLTVLVL